MQKLGQNLLCENFSKFYTLGGLKRNVTCESHNSVETHPNSEKSSGYMQFHLPYAMVKKIHSSGGSKPR
jgi:hypothetical protein